MKILVGDFYFQPKARVREAVESKKLISSLEMIVGSIEPEILTQKLIIRLECSHRNDCRFSSVEVLVSSGDS